MPTWKKIVVSGSGISQLTNDANYLAAGGAFSASVDSRLDVSETLSGSAHTQRAALDAAQTTANTNLSSSTATALRSEYVASVASLSGSAKTQREAQKSAADARLAAIETFTGSLDASFATDAEVTALSGAAETRRNQLDSAQTTANTNLSSSAHSQREAIKGLATSANNSLSSSTSTALRAEYVALDGAQTTANTNLSSSTATALRAEYVALDGAQTTANTNLSSSAAGALRTEYVAGDTALSSSLNTRIVSLESGGGTAGLSASAHTQREAIKGLATTANNSLSSSKSIALRAEYVAADTALSSSQKTYIDAKVAGIVNSAPATLDTLDELAAALNDDANFSASIATSIGNRLLTSTHNTYSGSAATALRAEYVAGDTALSSSTATALRAEYVAGDSALSSSAATALRAEYVAGDSALSASAHGDRVAKIAVLSASAHTARATGATSASSHAQRVALINTLSSSAATANDSSAITVRNLVGQTVVASSFEGDGSSLTNITVDQNATVASAFTSVTSHAVTHNFGTKNVLVQVYDDNDQVIIPASITSTNTNTSTVTFDGASTGIVVVARGGHVVSGSIPYANLINTPSASFSSRIDALSGAGHAQRLAVVSALSSSVDAHLDANITTLSASAHAARAGGATSASAHTQRIAVVNVHSSSAASALRSEYVAADTALSSSQKTYIDAKVAGIVDSAPGTLDTLNELAAALNDDPNFSASIATSIGNRLLTSTHNTYSSSAAGALRTEYVAGDTALSSSAHGQREAIKGLATAANNSLSSSTATALRTEYVAGDAALSSSAHTQREAIKGLATSANNSLSSSTATALRAEYVAGDSALSASSHSDRIAKVAALSASAHSARGSISSTFTIAGTAGSDSFATGQTLTFAGTGNEIETTVTNNQVQIGITTNPTLSGNVIVTGDLTVQGDTFENQVTNLNVEDRFILLNSGSTSGDVGIIFGGSDGVANVGSGIFWDSPSNVFGFADGITATATSATHDAKIGAITTSTAAPTAAPTFQGVGSIHVKTDSEDVYIYTAD